MNSKISDFVKKLKTLTLDPFDDPRGRESRNSLGLDDYSSYHSRYSTNPNQMNRSEQKRYDNLTRARNDARESALHRDSRRDERRSYRKSLKENSMSGHQFTPSLARIESQYLYSDNVLGDRYGPGTEYDGNHSEMFSGYI